MSSIIIKKSVHKVLMSALKDRCAYVEQKKKMQMDDGFPIETSHARIFFLGCKPGQPISKIMEAGKDVRGCFTMKQITSDMFAKAYIDFAKHGYTLCGLARVTVGFPDPGHGPSYERMYWLRNPYSRQLWKETGILLVTVTKTEIKAQTFTKDFIPVSVMI